MNQLTGHYPPPHYDTCWVCSLPSGGDFYCRLCLALAGKQIEAFTTANGFKYLRPETAQHMILGLMRSEKCTTS